MSDDVLDLIPQHELEQLDCPTIEMQAELWVQTMQGINHESLDKLLRSLPNHSLSLVSFESFNESCGFVNEIYFIQAYDSKQDANVELVLKILSPEKRFHGMKTDEAELILYLKANTTIPVPDILSYSNDAKSSLLKCQYILMKKAPGKILRQCLPPNPKDVPMSLINEMMDYIRQLRSLKPFANEHIGSFGKNAEGPVLLPVYPSSIPRKTYFEKWIDTIAFFINQMKLIQVHSELIKHLEETIDKFARKLEKLRIDGVDFMERLSLNHFDLNDSNIIVCPDTLKVSCVIDWEWGTYGPTDDDDFACEWYDDDEVAREEFKKIAKEIIASNRELSLSPREVKLKAFRYYLQDLKDHAHCCTNSNLACYKNCQDFKEKNIKIRQDILWHRDKLQSKLKTFDEWLEKTFDY